jgi:cell division protein FtsL
MQTQRHPVVSPTTTVSRQPRTPKSFSVKEKLFYVLVVVVVGLVVSVVAMRNTTIYVHNSELIELQRDVTNITKQNAILRQEVAALQAPKRLIETGIQLGLVMPTPPVPTTGPAVAATTFAPAQ